MLQRRVGLAPRGLFAAKQERFHSFFCSPKKTNQKKGAQKELASLRQLFGLMAFGQGEL